MRTVPPGQANVLDFPLVAIANGTPITTGTVSFYLKATTGANAGKWYKGSDGTWSATEQVAGASAHSARGIWELSLGSAVWTDGVDYYAYAAESGGLNILVDGAVACRVSDVSVAAIKVVTDKMDTLLEVIP